MKTIKFFIVLGILSNIYLPAFAQNRCDELRKELEQLERRTREVKSEIGKCGEPPSECTEQKASFGQIEVKTGCAEIKGNTLRIYFQAKHTNTNKPNTRGSFRAENCKIFDQNGKLYVGNNIKVGDTSKDRGYLYVQMVYDTWYSGYVEFFIGTEAVNNVKLFQFYLNKLYDFQNIEVKLK